MTHVAALLLLATAGCGGEPHAPPPADAGGRDAGSDAGPPRDPPCLENADFGEPQPDYDRCGVCVAPGERVLNPYWLSGIWDIHVAPMAHGLVVTMDAGETMATYVTNDGEVIPLPELPYDPVDYEEDRRRRWHANSAPYPIPGTDRVWIHTSFYTFDADDTTLQDRGDLVLYDLSTGGWERVATGHTLPIHGAAISTGELIGTQLLTLERRRRVARIRATPMGGIDVLDGGMLEDWDPPQLPYEVWPLADGGAALFVDRPLNISRPTGRPPEMEHRQMRQSWIVLVDGDLVRREPPIALSPPENDEAYEFGQVPYVVTSRERPDGRRSLLLRGLTAGSGGAFRSHFWLQRLDSAGHPAFPVPGIPVNTDEYLRESEWPDEEWGTTYTIRPLASGDAILWAYDVDLARGHSWAQKIDEAGALGERYLLLPPSSDRNDFGALTPLAPWGVLDPLGNVMMAEPCTAAFPCFDGSESHRAQLLDDATMSLAWPEALELQQCLDSILPPRTVPLYTAPAEEGMWAVWTEDVVAPDGYSYYTVKAARVLPDRTFAWAR